MGVLLLMNYLNQNQQALRRNKTQLIIIWKQEQRDTLDTHSPPPPLSLCREANGLTMYDIKNTTKPPTIKTKNEKKQDIEVSTKMTR